MLMQREVTDGAYLSAWRGRVLITAVLMLTLAYWAGTLRAPTIILNLVRTQDLPVLVIAPLAMLLLAWWQPALRLPSSTRGRHYAAAGGVLAALLAWGTYAVMGNFPLSRDEHMVVFDMAVFRSGRLAMPIAPEWQSYALALVPSFLLNIDSPVGFVSGYLPGNAALRAAFASVADPVWFNPLLVVVGGAALLDIARRTFPTDGRTQLVVLLIYGLSVQVLVNAMTTYSMTAHLALNLVWLAAFLRGGRKGHVVAIVTAFVAVGLHQLVFHPLFAAPFLLWKLGERRWKLVLAYAAAYLAIIGWWAFYPMIVSGLVAAAPTQSSRHDLWSQVIVPLLTNRDPRTIPMMILNMMRLFAWQNLALIPLLIAAVPAIRRERSLPLFLALGIAIWVLFLALVLPEQGRGWGYRYLNGYIGSFALLAGFGYRELEQRLGRKADGLVLALSAVTLVVAIPALLVGARAYLRPHLAVDRLIEQQRTPFVLVDDENSPSLDGRFRDNGSDHVRNMPDLSNRPLRFSAAELTPAILAGLCTRGKVTLITHEDMQRLGFILNVPRRSPKFEALVADSNSPACFRPARHGFVR